MNTIELRGVRTHNLKNFNLTLPHNHLIVITGVSGSGKSSLAFDTLYAEGQRRYVESLSTYARQFLERMEKPDIDSISGILPAIAIESKNLISNARSTVGTQTEINDYLRLLFARVGHTVCSGCGERVEPDTPQKIAEKLLAQANNQGVYVLFSIAFGEKSRKYTALYLDELVKQGFIRAFEKGQIVDLVNEEIKKRVTRAKQIEIVVDRLALNPSIRLRLVDSLETAYRYGKGNLSVFLTDSQTTLKFSDRFYCPRCDIEYIEPSPHIFSFNSPLGACPECQGFGRVITIDPDLVVPDPRKTLAEGAIEPWTKPSRQWEFEQMKEYCEKKHIPLDVPFKDLSGEQKRKLFEGDSGYMGVRDFFGYLEKKTYKVHIRVFLSRYRSYVVCLKCKGTRLRPEALLVRVGGKNIDELMHLTIDEIITFFEELKLTVQEEETVAPVLLEIRNRTRFLKEVGLGYLTLERLSRTLSGGEAQRINLAASLGSNLVDTLYVLDEPSVGLHERDNHLLMGILKRLRDLGNTVVVIEHDRSMMEGADQLIDLGPEAGEKGGEVVFQGKLRDLTCVPHSLTAKYLRGEEKIELERDQATVRPIEQAIVIRQASEHNLKAIDVEIPLGKFVVLTGVSGSGKSTLIYEVLYNNYQRYRGRAVSDVGAVKRVEGFHRILDMVLVDQSPIGRTPRSNPITYIKAFDEIRKVFASTKEAKIRGLSATDFSFNVEGGRCPACEGDGQVKIEMHFLADIFVTCDQCNGTRYQKQVLEVRYKGKSIHDVLNITVREALAFFHHIPALVKKLVILENLGLGYLRLGQSATTLSQGEAQRLKLALEMMESTQKGLLYLFDEPTTGLHYHDIHYLMRAFGELLERGHSLVVIEHNMEVIKCAAHIIDLGPEGGERGGEVVYAGPVRGILNEPRSYTGKFLRPYLSRK